jgi:polar amino acid transport system substrate-binding protein
MNKHIWLLIGLLFTSELWASQTIKISTSEWPPYISQKAPNHGYISQVITEAFQHVNIKVEFVFTPWARAYEEAKHGNVDATSTWYKDKKHASYFHFSAPLSEEKLVFFRLKSEEPATWKSFSDFDDLNIALTRSYTYTPELWHYAKNNNDRISIVTQDKQSFKMLLLGRVDLVPAQEIVGWHHLHTLFAKEQVNRVEVLRPSLKIHTAHVLFPKVNENSEQLLEQFNKGLAILIKNGRLNQLKEALIEGKYSN